MPISPDKHRDRRFRSIALLLVPAACSFFATAFPTVAMGQSTHQTDADSKAGSWRKEIHDNRSVAVTTLILRSDGTYTKTLKSVVDGRNYGGTHEGRWTAEGNAVHLSGDGNWPPYTEDLGAFTKMKE